MGRELFLILFILLIVVMMARPTAPILDDAPSIYSTRRRGRVSFSPAVVERSYNKKTGSITGQDVIGINDAAAK